MMEERWFSVRLLLESVHSRREGPDGGLYEDKLVLVRATNEANARQKAEKLGRSSDLGYNNAYGERVTWRFKEILDVKEVFEDAITDGVEVYFTHLKGKEVEHLRRMLQPFDS